MTLETVTVSVGGQNFATWEKITIHAGVKHAVRSLELHIVDQLGAPLAPGVFGAGAFVTATASGDLMFTGYVDRLRPHLDGKTYTAVISARSKGQDALDSSVDHTKPDYVNSNVLSVAQDQDAFGIGFSADFKPDGFDRWRPNVGHTLWEALVPLCEDEGATMSGQPDGSIKITRAGESAEPQGGPIVEGVNLWKGDGDFDLSGQHSVVNEHGQSYKGSGAQAIAIHAVASNDTVTRHRPLHHHHDRQTDRHRALRRAKRRRDKEQGEGKRAPGVHMRGWRDSGGAIWMPGKKVYVKSPSLYLCQYMLIESVLYTQGGKTEEGTFSQLHLVDPRAHGGTGGGVNKSGADWDFDDSAAQ